MHTSSIAWPNLFDVASNKVSVLQDATSVTNRCKLLILTEPTEIYNSPDQGVGLKRHLWHYNNDNQKAIIIDRIKDQLRLHEPSVIPEETQYSDGLQFSEVHDSTNADYNELKMTIALKTTFGDDTSLEFEIDQAKLFGVENNYDRYRS